MANITITNTFTNSTTADATQVNQNFTDIINGTSDGTKDFSISALTVAGALTANGNVTLGNASSDEITITGSLASTINIKTTNTYNIGSSTLGLAGIYLGANSQTVRLVGSGSMSATWTMTLPITAGTDGYVLQNSGSGVTAWVSKTVLKTVNKTTTYTATSDDDIITVTTGSAWTLTLPAAASNTGKNLIIKKTSSDFNALTIDGNASETIDGATTTSINTQYESIEIHCDGSNWHVLKRNIPSVWTSYTQTINGSGGNPVKGTTTVEAAYWRRVGDSIEMEYLIRQSGVGTAGTGTYLFVIPNSLVADPAKIESTFSTTRAIVGSAAFGDSVDTYYGTASLYSATAIQLVGANDTVNGVCDATNTPISDASFNASFSVVIPITGWNG